MASVECRSCHSTIRASCTKWNFIWLFGHFTRIHGKSGISIIPPGMAEKTRKCGRIPPKAEWLACLQTYCYGKCYYQSGPDWCKSLLPVQARTGTSPAPQHWQPFDGQCPRLPLKNETGTNPYYWTLTDPRGGVLTLTDPRAGNKPV